MNQVHEIFAYNSVFVFCSFSVSNNLPIYSTQEVIHLKRMNPSATRRARIRLLRL